MGDPPKEPQPILLRKKHVKDFVPLEPPVVVGDGGGGGSSDEVQDKGYPGDRQGGVFGSLKYSKLYGVALSRDKMVGIEG